MGGEVTDGQPRRDRWAEAERQKQSQGNGGRETEYGGKHRTRTTTDPSAAEAGILGRFSPWALKAGLGPVGGRDQAGLRVF